MIYDIYGMIYMIWYICTYIWFRCRRWWTRRTRTEPTLLTLSNFSRNCNFHCFHVKVFFYIYRFFLVPSSSPPPMSWWLILQLFSSPNLNIYRLLKITIYSLCEKSTEKRSKKTRLRALFQSLMWSADLIIINNDDIRENFEDKDNIGGNCYNSNSYWHDYSAIQLMFNMLVIQLVLKPVSYTHLTLPTIYSV